MIGNELYVLRVLEKYTDEEHYLSQSEISRKVQEMFGVDIDRKTIRNNLFHLAEFSENAPDGFPYRITCRERDKSFAMTQHLFEPCDVRIMTDLISGCESLEKGDAHILIEKIYDSLSESQCSDIVDYRKIVKTSRCKTINEETGATIEEILNCVKDKKKAEFMLWGFNLYGKVVAREGDVHIKINPYHLIASKGKYYLLGIPEGEDRIKAFRIDYIRDFYEIDEKLDPINSYPFYKDGFKLNDYLNTHLYFTNDEVVDAELILHGESAIRAIYDWFGEDNVKIKIDEYNVIHAYLKHDIESLYYWVMQYNQIVTVAKPMVLRSRVIHSATQLLRRARDTRIGQHVKKDTNITFHQLLKTGIYHINDKNPQPSYNQEEVSDFWYSLLKTNGNRRWFAGHVSLNPYKGNSSDKHIKYELSDNTNLYYGGLYLYEILKFCKRHNIEYISDGIESKEVNEYLDLLKSRIPFLIKMTRRDPTVNLASTLDLIKPKTHNQAAERIALRLELLDKHNDRKLILNSFSRILNYMTFNVSED